MEITATVSSINTGITTNATDPSEQEETRPNAFGIGEANRTEVELSPQARILQQTDANQRELSERLEQQRQAARDRAEQAREDDNAQTSIIEAAANATSNENSTQRSNLSQRANLSQRTNTNAERATEVYQTISKLV